MTSDRPALHHMVRVRRTDDFTYLRSGVMDELALRKRVRAKPQPHAKRASRASPTRPPSGRVHPKHREVHRRRAPAHHRR